MNYDELVAFFQAQTGLKGVQRREGVWEFQGIPESEVDPNLEEIDEIFKMEFLTVVDFQAIRTWYGGE